MSFEVNGEVLAGFSAGELQGKNILLSFQPASSTDQAIYDRYSSIFDIPAYAVYMKPVLLVDNEVVAEGEEYLESTLGTKGSFTINLTSGGEDAHVTNDITTGSMYAVTLDSQSITAVELQAVYDEAAVLKASVTEENVYSEEYLGKLLALAGKLYFAQVDIADTIAADMYDVSVTRSLSEGITGYEIRTSSLYGRVTSLSEGSLYIDVDEDTHSVVSLNGEEDVPREYMMSSGMMGSLYESTVWEQITGYESVSTISILAKAQEENIDILLISKDNLNTQIEKLNTDEVTKQTVINAVNSGKVVTIPAEDVTMGDWHGTGYIVTNPETGAGAYMISGGLNGGALTVVLTIAVLCGCFASVTATAMLVWAAVQFFAAIITPLIYFATVIVLTVLIVSVIEMNRQMWLSYIEYIFTGDLGSAENAANLGKKLGETAITEMELFKLFNAKINVPQNPSSSSSTYLEQLNNMPQNKINHIIEGSKNSNHHWEDLVPDKNWEDIKRIIANVMDTGVEGTYKSVFSKKAIINGYEIEVTYTKLVDGTVRISDAWVK